MKIMLYLRDQNWIYKGKTALIRIVIFSISYLSQQYVFYAAFSSAIILTLLSELNITLELESLWQQPRSSQKL